MTPGQQVTVSISTYSQVYQTYPSSGQPPKITLNGNPFPQPRNQPPNFGTGAQLAVLDPTKDITSPAAIVSNQYLPVISQGGSWMTSYEWMWANAVRQLLTSGNPDAQIVILATFGLDANMPPTSDALAMFLPLGAGPLLQQWETSVDVGSQSGNWVGFPANYILIGNPGYGYGEGTEAYQAATQNSITTSAQATLTNAA
jgi:hypothetical protein